MKKIITLFSFMIIFFTGKTFAQNESTWTFNDKPAEQFFRTRTEFNITMSGISQAQATDIYNQIKSNKDVLSCTPAVKNAAGSYDIKIIMARPQQGKYYSDWAQKMGVDVFVLGGKSKKLSDRTGR